MKISLAFALSAAIILLAVLIHLVLSTPPETPPTSSSVTFDDSSLNDTSDALVKAAQAEAERVEAERLETERLAQEEAEKLAQAEAQKLTATEAASKSRAVQEVEHPQSYTDASWFRSAGVTQYNGWRVTYYNPERLGISAYQLGLKTVGAPIVNRGDGIGTVNGLVAVSLPANYAYGTLIDTPFGQGIVVDHSVSAMDCVVFW